MYTLSFPLLIYFVTVIAVFCLYGVHRYWLVWLCTRSGGRAVDPAPRRFQDLPTVTVQLPMYNEGRVAERVIRAACGLDYPRDRLQIQVLDDSTDESADLVRRCCERMAAGGHDVQHLHRADRTGYKAGALASGLRDATGELVAMFDADFVPPPDFLVRTVDHFTDERVGLVQARWQHLNRRDSLLTEIQAICLDGHFVIEQAARARAGRWFNFNGTAGVWRRACIDDAGGWTHDTLAEDTDLSYRAQLRGWKFVYRPDVACPAELPTTVSALMTQQHRWNKGLTQTGIKLLPSILRARAPVATRIEALLHLTSPLPYAAMFLLTLLIAPAFMVGLPVSGIGPGLAVGLGSGCLALGTLAAAAFYVASQRAQGNPILGTILRLPALMAVGVGLSAVNSRAIVEAVFGRESAFVRTPKSGGRAIVEGAAAAPRRLPAGVFELGMGLLMLCFLAPAATRPFTLVGVPFIALFAAGYLAVGVPQVLAHVRRLRAGGASVALPAPD